MAPEAGSAMHEVFSAVRIWQLHHVQKLPKHATASGNRLFGKERHKDAWNASKKQSDDRDKLIDYSYGILHSGDFYDDPQDNIRTIANMEIATIRYVDQRLRTMTRWPIYVENNKKPDCLIGIEQVFDVVLHYDNGEKIRFIGTLDGLVFSDKHQRYFLDENKTASRLDTGWRESFEMTFQVTGYIAACTTVFGMPVWDARINGVKIKPSGGEDVVSFNVSRTINDVEAWARWVYWTSHLYEEYKDDFENAPRFTHSCNRYFRPCSLVSFCADTPQGRLEQWEEMVEAPPSPSERAVMEQF